MLLPLFFEAGWFFSKLRFFCLFSYFLVVAFLFVVLLLLFLFSFYQFQIVFYFFVGFIKKKYGQMFEKLQDKMVKFYQCFMCRSPRPPLPLSLVWTEEEAAVILQSAWRGHLVRVLYLLQSIWQPYLLHFCSFQEQLQSTGKH